MSDGLYEILALAARYVFAAVMLLIVLRAARITLKDSSRAGRLRRLVPETGLSGELLVVEGDERARRGMRYPVIREGTLGSARASDIRVMSSSVRRKHARFELRDEGLAVIAREGARLLTADGRRARKLIARDGDSFFVGKVRLMLVLIDAAGREGEQSAEDALFEAPAAAADSREPLYDVAGDLFATEDDVDEDLYS